MGQQVGNQYSSYLLVQPLGKGGFAEVWLGEHQKDQSEAAIKILNILLPTTSDQNDFLKEAHMLGRLVHPHVVKMLDYGIQGDKPYLILEYAPHGTLRQRHPKGSQLALPLILQYVKQIAEGLQYAHDTRVIHRDIKPENMLLDSGDNVLLSDFGIALPGQTLPYSQTQNITGTTGYIAPEQLDGHPAFASDQYSLAVVVYEWLCGSLPFKGSAVEIRLQQQFSPPALRNLVSGITPEVEEVVFKALSEKIADRFRRVQDFAEALEDAFNNSWSFNAAGPVNVNFAGNMNFAGNANPVGGGGNNPFLNTPPQNQQQQGPLVLPAQGPQHTPPGGFPWGALQAGQNNQQARGPIDPQRTIPAGPGFNPSDPFGSGYSFGQAHTTATSSIIRSNWFERNFMKQSKNKLFIYGGAIVDFFFAISLGVWLHYGDLSWNLWLASFVSAWVVRALCAATKKRYIAFPLAGALTFYWFLGSWALGTVVRTLISIEPVPPYIIGLLVGCAALYMHLRYVLRNKKT